MCAPRGRARPEVLLRVQFDSVRWRGEALSASPRFFPAARAATRYNVAATPMARVPLVPLLLLLALGMAAPVHAQASQGAQDFDGLFVRALELQKAGDLLGAIETYKAALPISPDRADALSNLGAAYVRLGQYDDGIQQYEAALKVDPTNNAVRLNLALAYYKS